MNGYRAMNLLHRFTTGSFGRRLTVSLGVLCLSLILVSAVSACPGCKDAVSSNDSSQADIARGYFWSILFMLSMPALIFGTLGTYVYVEIRRARTDRENLQDPTSGLTNESKTTKSTSSLAVPARSLQSPSV